MSDKDRVKSTSGNPFDEWNYEPGNSYSSKFSTVANPSSEVLSSWSASSISAVSSGRSVSEENDVASGSTTSLIYQTLREEQLNCDYPKWPVDLKFNLELLHSIIVFEDLAITFEK